MAASSLIDGCRFTPTLGGLTDWTYSTAVIGYNSPALAGVVNGAQYSYHAQSADLSQWEDGIGLYNTGTGVLTRATVLYNSSGTGTAAGQSGAGTKITFSAVPQVAIVALKEDLQPVLVAGQLPGTATNDNANSGNVGEHFEVQLLVGSAASLTSGAAVNIVSQSVPAGDWIISGVGWFGNGGSTAVTTEYAGISTTSATLPGLDSGQIAGAGGPASVNVGVPTPMVRLSLATATTVYLVVKATYSGSAPAGWGTLKGWRMR